MALLRRLAAMSRGSCSSGERAAARMIGDELAARGATVALEPECVNDSYLWPLGVTSAAGVVGGALALSGRRRWAVAVGASATALAADDLIAMRPLLRRLLPRRQTMNVVGRIGDRSAERALVVVAHHDAARSGFFFHPRIARWAGRHGAGEMTSSRTSGLVMAPLVAGPGLVSVGAVTGVRTVVGLGAMVCAGIIASFMDIARRPVVPGANDNLTGVATLVALSESLRHEPLTGLQVILVSTGAEEALMEGMRAFVKSHRDELISDDVRVLCVDTVGSPHLVLPEGEGMVRLRMHDSGLKDVIERCAHEQGIALRRGGLMRVGTDGYIALAAGLPSALLTSVGDDGVATNYHWPTDTPERLDEEALRQAQQLCVGVARALAEQAAADRLGL